MLVVTHVSPDFDCIGSVWLLKRYGGLDEAMVMFVNTSRIEQSALIGADAVVDTGGVYDPKTLRFDHHQLVGEAARETCAMKQVFEYLLKEGKRIEYLRPLVELIYREDVGKGSGEGFSTSEVGIHALLKGFSKKYTSANLRDQRVLEYGMEILDDLDSNLKSQHLARIQLDARVVYKSKDNLLWAIDGGSEESTKAAFERGAILVLFNSPSSVSSLSYAVGLWRAREVYTPHCGDLVEKLLDTDVDIWSRDELRSWYLHPAGFYAGRGSLKAPRVDPVIVSQFKLASLFDKIWER